MTKVNASGPKNPASVSWKLVNQDWSGYTIQQIADRLGKPSKSVSALISDIKKYHGIEVAYKKRGTSSAEKKKVEHPAL